MPVIGFNFDKILAENRTLDNKEKLKSVQTNIVINDIKQEKVGVSVKEGVARLEFLFELAYEPKIADITLEGHVIFVAPEKDIKKMISDWSNNKGKVDFESVKSIINLVLIKCNIKALSLSQEVNLAPHLPLPIMGSPSAKKDGADKYIG